jgi:hypothetical protein
MGRALPWLRAADDAQQHLTLIHGDVKTSNCFFPRAQGDDGDDGGGRGPGGPPVVFDFQWVGGGRSGAADLAYFLCGGSRFVALGGSGADAACEELLVGYWREFQQVLLPLPTPPPLTFEQLREQFNTELVFYYAAALPYLLDPLTPEMMVANRGKYAWLLHEQFEGALWWLTQRVLGVLEDWARCGKLET